MKKTNAMRMLDKQKVNYEVFCYDENITQGTEVAKTLNEDEKMVFKTLVTVANTKENFVFVVPVAESLDLKKAAKVAGVKSIEMIKQKDLLPLTGYIHGGCSPVGMKKQFKIFIDNHAENFEYVFVSGGHVGMQIKISPKNLHNMIDFQYGDLII